MEGGKVVLATGGSLRIESLQDTESYKSRSNVKGGGLASDVFKDSAGHKKLDKPYLSAETARGYTDSDYASVKEQAGIYAGQEGYDISVKDNTHLKGAVIDNKGSVDKNTLRTGTLSWEDIENKADYKSGGSGISYMAKLGGNVNKAPHTPEKTTGTIRNRVRIPITKAIKSAEPAKATAFLSMKEAF